MEFVIPCLLGLEGLIADELRAQQAQHIAPQNGRVFFAGDFNTLARANLCSRFAERVQLVLGRFAAHSFEALFEGTKALPWEDYIGRLDAFPVKGYSIRSQLFSVRDCQAIIKKAVVERLKSVHHIAQFEETGPVHQIQFALQKDEVLLTLDSSGAGLHKRGYRTQAGIAPLKETLAAALCQIAHLRPFHHLYDPMCGSGTILIEGALMAKQAAPGLHRPFAAERWSQMPQKVWQEERERAAAAAAPAPEFCAYGYDIDPEMIATARANAKRAGVDDCIAFAVADVADFAPNDAHGTVICNPPYGDRLLDAAAAEQIAQTLGARFAPKKGWSYCVLSANDAFERQFARAADARRKLYNGMIKCTAYLYFKPPLA